MPILRSIWNSTLLFLVGAVSLLGDSSSKDEKLVGVRTRKDWLDILAILAVVLSAVAVPFLVGRWSLKQQKLQLEYEERADQARGVLLSQEIQAAQLEVVGDFINYLVPLGQEPEAVGEPGGRQDPFESRKAIALVSLAKLQKEIAFDLARLEVTRGSIEAMVALIDAANRGERWQGAVSSPGDGAPSVESITPTSPELDQELGRRAEEFLQEHFSRFLEDVYEVSFVVDSGPANVKTEEFLRGILLRDAGVIAAFDWAGKCGDPESPEPATLTSSSGYTFQGEIECLDISVSPQRVRGLVLVELGRTPGAERPLGPASRLPAVGDWVIGLTLSGGTSSLRPIGRFTSHDRLPLALGRIQRVGDDGRYLDVSFQEGRRFYDVIVDTSGELLGLMNFKLDNQGLLGSTNDQYLRVDWVKEEMAS